jgi:hypothetical protein
MDTSINRTFLSAFNNVVTQFINDLIITFPEEMEFKKFKTGFSLLSKTNPRKFLTVFNYYIGNYKSQIIEHDESFFLITKSDNLSGVEDNSITQLLDKLKIYWKTLSASNKDKIWTYLNTLMVLSDKC